MKQQKPGPGRRTLRILPRQILFALGMVGVSTLLLAASLIAAHAPIAQAHTARKVVTGNLSSSPASGPVGATITVSGSNWSQPDGVTVNLGYLVGSICSVVTDSQPGTFSSGSFQGWFRWPQGTGLGTFSVCAIIGGSSVTAGSFTVLSNTPPQVTMAPNSVQERQQVTVTALNYYPAGTNVTFYWATTSNQIEFEMSSAVSDSNGRAVMGFAVPITSLASGNYLVEAVAGGGTPAALFSSTGFTYSAPVVPPSPTPKPSPNPSPSPSLSPTPTQNPSPTPTIAASVTPTASVTGTPGVTPTRSGTGTGTPTQVAGATPTSTTTTSSPTGTNSSSSGDSSDQTLLIAGGIGGLALLIATLSGVFVMRRRGKSRLAQVSSTPPQGPDFPGQPTAFPMPGMMQAPGGVIMPMSPGRGVGFAPVSPMYSYSSVQPVQPAPEPVLVGAYAGVQSGQDMQGAIPTQAPLPYRSLLKPLTPPPQNDPSAFQAMSAPGVSGMPTVSTPLPQSQELDALRRQVQAGIFVQPRPGPGQYVAPQD